VKELNKNLFGLIAGMSISIVSFITALIMFLICFFIFDVRLHSWGGHPYVDTVIYYNYMVIIFGLLISTWICRYMSINCSKKSLKSISVVASICSVAFIISSWIIVNSYFYLESYFPPIEGWYFLIGYGLSIYNYVLLGLYLFIIQIITGAIIQYKNKSITA
jgi:hypothetical protein